MKNKLLKIAFILIFFWLFSLASPTKTFAACPPNNLACEKGTTSNGSYWVYWPQNTVNGNYSDLFQSNQSSNGYVQIDLGASNQIAKVKILSGGLIWSGATTTVCLSATDWYWVNNNCIQVSSASWNDGIWGEVNFASPSYRYVTVIANNYQGTWHEIEVYAPCAAAQSCSTACGYPGGTVPDGTCGLPHFQVDTTGSLSNNLVSYWKLDDGTPGQTGVAAQDSVGTNNGTATGTTVVGPPPASKLTNARQLSGTNTITTPTVASTQTTDISISAWVYLPQAPTALVVLPYNGNTGANGYGLILSNGSCGVGTQINLLLGGRSCNALTTTASVPLGTWTFIVLTRSGSTWSLYLNGNTTPVGTGTLDPLAAPSGGTTIANNNNSGATMRIDEVGFWNRALNSTERLNLYNGGNGNPRVTTSGTTTCPAIPAPPAQACPTTCGYPGGTVPDGSCGVITCPSIPPAGVINPATCSEWSSCSGPTCGIGTQTRTCQDYCGNPIVPNPSQQCIMSGPGTGGTFTGTVMNAPSAVGNVRVCATNATYGTFCTETSPSSYTLELPTDAAGTTTYTFSVSEAGYTTTPASAQASSACGATPAGPTFWFVSSAGAVYGQTVNAGSGNYSQGGAQSTAPSGYHLSDYVSAAPVVNASYDFLLSTVLKNAQNATPLLEADIKARSNCVLNNGIALTTTNSNLGSTTPPTVHSFDWYCYNSAGNFDTQLNNAIANNCTVSPCTKVLYPNNFTGPVTVSTVKTFAAGDNIISFIPGSLQVNANVDISPSINNASGVFIMKYIDSGNAGNLKTAGAVRKLDGLYIFPGSFDDNSDSNPSALDLTGYGSLINTGTSTWIFNRPIAASSGNAAEKWYYQPKYLFIYNAILSSAKYTWRELPPQ